MNQYNSELDDILGKESDFDLKKWLYSMVRMWPWFILSLVLCLVLSFIYLRYAHPVYGAVASILVKDEKKGAEIMDNSVLKEMGLGGDNKLVENETEVLKSPDLIEEVVKKLKLYISITRFGGTKSVAVFDREIPFNLLIENPQDIKEAIKIQWQIKESPNGFLFKMESEKIYKKLQFGNIYNANGIKFYCNQSRLFFPDDLYLLEDTASYYYDVRLYPINAVVAKYSKTLLIEQATKLATVINLNVTDNNENRATAILRSLIQVYNQEGLEDRNRVTDSTINFLNERLISVSNELQGVEGRVEQFKTQNRVTDITADVQQFMTIAQDVDVKKAQNETQLNIVNSMEKDLEKNQDNPQLVPSTLGIEEPSLGLLIEQHNQLVLQKERISQKTGPQNPLLLDLNDQIKEIRAKLLGSIRTLKDAYHISLNDVTKRDAILNKQIHNTPTLERQLIQITRNKDVQQQIYAFLLQKREESAVTRASSVEDSRTIVQPRSLELKWPKGKIVYIIGLLFGILIPIGIMFLRDFLNNKIGDISQIEQQTSSPILGSISHVKKISSPIVIGVKSRSVVSEQIRNIRTAISFTSKGKSIKSILVTSFQPGDGKSFVSLNLAASYALLDKRTLIMEFDLRKPHIRELLKIDASEGLSSVLTGQTNLENSLIEIPGYNKNLFLLPAGYLPPNPAELIAGKYMGPMMDLIKNSFDIVIIDTPPFSLVTDASLLENYADISTVVLRQGHTNKHVYKDLSNHISKNSSHPVYLLINDIGKKKRYDSGYTSYKYGNGYFQDED